MLHNCKDCQPISIRLVGRLLTNVRRHDLKESAQDDPNCQPESSKEFRYGKTNGIVKNEPIQSSTADLCSSPKKRTADDAELDVQDATSTKKSKSDSLTHDRLPDPPNSTFSLFCKEDFREHFCRCSECYPLLKKHPQLLEEEESYEPPVSESGEEGGQSAGTGSLLDRGEAALSNVDRVRAIGKIPETHLYVCCANSSLEGVMVYNHLKDKVKSFLQPFAESGQAVGAEDIKAYFEKLRGDEQGIKEAAIVNAESGGNDNGDNRREQSGRSKHHLYL